MQNFSHSRTHRQVIGNSKGYTEDVFSGAYFFVGGRYTMKKDVKKAAKKAVGYFSKGELALWGVSVSFILLSFFCV